MKEKHDTGDSYTYRTRLPDSYKPEMVRLDPSLEPEERETVIILNDKEGTAEISSAQKVVIRYLLGHPYFEVEEITIVEDKIVGVSGNIPRNCILITSRPRSNFSAGFKRRGVRKR